MTNINKYPKIVLLFYNSVAPTKAESLHDIPTESMSFIMSVGFDYIATPFILADLRKKLSHRAIMRKYGVTHSLVRSIGRKHNLCK